ncbi:hypothetical protein K0U00_11480, partial [Paenibacillus sepulcri]|nr:hypothetical protein [Paenibacillus sepulcri]
MSGTNGKGYKRSKKTSKKSWKGAKCSPKKQDAQSTEEDTNGMPCAEGEDHVTKGNKHRSGDVQRTQGENRSSGLGGTQGS